MTSERVAVVVGSSTGIGLEIVRQFARHGITTVLTGRSPDKISKAINLLEQQGLHVLSHVLDVTDPESIQEFAAWLKDELGGLDILVNSAGTLHPSKLVMDTNYYGIKHITEAVLPLMRPGSKIVMISGSASRLDLLRGEAYATWVPKLTNVEALSEGLIHSYVQSFLQDEEHGKHIEKGWVILDTFDPPDMWAAGAVSKSALNAYTRLLARDLSNTSSGHQIYANCMCPGLTATTLTGNVGHSVETAADTAIWLALLPQEESPSGQFFVNRTEVGFEQIPFFLDGRLVFPAKDWCQEMTNQIQGKDVTIS